MIHLVIAPEPPSFREKVRIPGENALALLAGESLPHRRKGRRIGGEKKIRGQLAAKRIDDFAYWQECLDDLHDAYHGICAYYCFFIHKAALPHVDHFVAKQSGDRGLAYEWSNYRLACGYANACKNKEPDILDPTLIEDGWFCLVIETLTVYANPALPDFRRGQVTQTIKKLKLNEGRAMEVRRHAMDHFRSGRVGFSFLELDHPFLAKELARQGIFSRDQLPSLPPQIIETIEPELMDGVR